MISETCGTAAPRGSQREAWVDVYYWLCETCPIILLPFFLDLNYFSLGFTKNINKYILYISIIIIILYIEILNIIYTTYSACMQKEKASFSVLWVSFFVSYCGQLSIILHTREPSITHACNPSFCRKLSFRLLKLQHIIWEPLTQETVSDLYNSRQLILKCSLLHGLGVLVLTIHPWAEKTTIYIFRCVASRKNICMPLRFLVLLLYQGFICKEKNVQG